jgi:hypothetical protein
MFFIFLSAFLLLSLENSGASESSNAFPVSKSNCSHNDFVRMDNLTKQELEDREIILQSQLFDVDYYLGCYPDVSKSKTDPCDHYIRYGWGEKRAPNAKLDGQYLFSYYSDFGKKSPLIEYIKREKKQNESSLTVNLDQNRTGNDLSENCPLFFNQEKEIANIALLMMVKDEEDIIDWNLKWHYSLGFRKFFILNNKSSDKTEEIIKSFANKVEKFAHVHLMYDPIVEKYQSQKTTGIFHYALSVYPKLKWIFPIDADEFWCVTRPLNDILSHIPEEYSSVSVKKARYFSTKEEKSVFQEGLLFMSYRSPFSVGGHSKMFLRASKNLIIGQGNHTCEKANSEPVSYFDGDLCEIRMREFQYRSISQTRKKIINNGISNLAARGGKTDLNNSNDLTYTKYLNGGNKEIEKFYHENIKKKENLTFDPMPFFEMDEFFKKITNA